MPFRRISFVLGLLLAAAVAGARETEVRYLSGTGPEDAVPWEFFCTGGRNSGTWTTIPVPSCWEQQGFGTYNYGVHHRPNKDKPAPPPLADEEGRYRHKFRVPAEWRDRAVRIVFDGSMTDTEVWINGQPAGPVHQGSFYRFHHDITALLDFTGDNLLEVTVRKKSANEGVNRAERIGDYWIFGGIFRPVWLEARPRESIEWTGVDARADSTFTANVHLGVPARAAGRVTAVVTDFSGREIGPALTVAVEPGTDKATLTGRFEAPARWTAETPHLHRVRFTYTPGDSKESHEVTARFGFRTFEVRPQDGLYLNGTKIILKGVNRHCFNADTGRTISRAQSYADVRLIKEMNMNAVRMSHYQPDVHFLEACDELGLYVLNELAGWQGAYDTPTGARLIGQLVRRDVNHPSIVFWDNGNEGGWNTANDGEFAKWDLQQRPVLHPWAKFSGVDTDHYEVWDSHVKKSAGPMIYMPTEFLHGLYDGGIGAGFHDYWDVMKKSPTVAGGFFWVFADEGIARTDQGGRIDNAGNLAPDGIVGPRGEKEGSFFTVKEIWSPVQVSAPGETRGVLPGGWDGTLQVTNAYNFTNLKDCTFEWKLLHPPDWRKPATPLTTFLEGRIPGPDVAPGQTGTIRVPLPEPTAVMFNVLQVTARGPDGSELWTWSWGPSAFNIHRTSRPPEPDFSETPEEIIVTGSGFELHWNKTNGRLVAGTLRGRPLPLAAGPQLIGYHRVDRKFESVLPASSGVVVTARKEANQVVVTAASESPKVSFRWILDLNGDLSLRYDYEVEGEFDVLGIQFDVPPAAAKRWFGRGPYRVWRNRMEGGIFGLHEVAFNDSTPGETYAYPEFNGYFRDWRWVSLETNAGRLTVESSGLIPFFGLGKPRDGVNGLLDLPDVGLSFLDVVPAMRNKFHTTDQLGPQSLTPTGKRAYQGTLNFHFGPR
jgi:hypothetical protein